MRATAGRALRALMLGGLGLLLLFNLSTLSSTGPIVRARIAPTSPGAPASAATPPLLAAMARRRTHEARVRAAPAPAASASAAPAAISPAQTSPASARPAETGLPPLSDKPILPACAFTVDAPRRERLRRITGPVAGGCAPADGRAVCVALRELLRGDPAPAQRIVVTSATSAQGAHLRAFLDASGALRLRALVLGMDADVAQAVIGLGTTARVAIATLDNTGAGRCAARKWEAIAALLGGGVGVLYADVDAVIASNPWSRLAADSDYEGLSTGWEDEDARGHVMGSDDPPMGWSRYCETMRAALLDPSLFFMQPTVEARALALRMAELAAAAGWAEAFGAAWGAGPDEATALTMELLAPAHDAVTRVGASVRVLPVGCWLPARSAWARLPAWGGPPPAALLVGRHEPPPADIGADLSLNMASAVVSGLLRESAGASAARQRSAVDYFHRGAPLGAEWSSLGYRLPSRWNSDVDPLMAHARRVEATKDLALTSKCARRPLADGPRRPLRHVAPPGGPWPVGCGGANGPMCAVLRAVAIERAVMTAVSNGNILHMLGLFVDTVKRVGVANFCVVALDERTVDFLKARGTPHYLRALKTRSGSTDNHATSGLKFQILAELLATGTSVLMSDVDIVWTASPFGALYRDSDVEGMSDGWDDDAAYGHVHTLRTGPASASPALAADGTFVAPAGDALGPLRSVRLVARNSGLFFLEATHESLNLMRILADRLVTEAVWDQSAFNQAPASPARFSGPLGLRVAPSPLHRHASKRTMLV